jgi:hypothetical protein
MIEKLEMQNRRVVEIMNIAELMDVNIKQSEDFIVAQVLKEQR